MKFSVFAIAGLDPRPLYRGEFEEIGTAPHFFVRDMDGAIVADERDSVAEIDEDLMIARHTLRLLGTMSGPRKKGEDAR